MRGLVVLCAVLLGIVAEAAPLPDQRAIQSHCNERAAQNAAGFNACVAAQTQLLRTRNVECARQSQMQDVRSAELARFMSRCQAADDFTDFRLREATQRQAAGLKTGQEVPVGMDTLAQWTHFDGAVTLRPGRVLLAQWIGALRDGQAQGPGELQVEFEYVKGGLDDRVRVGSVHLAGTMDHGALSGTVKALKHTAFDGSADIAVENEFASGRSIGLVANHGTGCRSAASAEHGATGTRLYGVCRDGAPYSGLVVYEYNQQAFDIACLTRGRIGQRNELDAFELCQSFWPHLPGYCAAGDYRGQCANGQAHGVGVRKSVRTEPMVNPGGGMAALPNLLSPGMRSYYLQRGSFLQGRLSGYGYSGKLEGCGMAGCSGDNGELLGWFDNDQLRFACSQFGGCTQNLSGSAYTRGLRAGPAAAADSPVVVTEFSGALATFQGTGDREYLRKASQLANTAADRAALEFELIRIAGFDKVFATSAVLSARDDEKINFSERDRILGYVRSTDALVPLRVTWQLHNDAAGVALTHGQYSVGLRMGVRARIKRTTCVLAACKDQIVTEQFESSAQPVLSKAQPRASGSFDLRQILNSASSIFGSASVSNVIDLEPYVLVESVRPRQ